MHTNEDKDISYLLSLQAVRDRSRLVLKAAEEGALNNFEYHSERMPEVADFVLNVISVSPVITTPEFLFHVLGRWRESSSRDTSETLALTGLRRSLRTVAGSISTSEGSTASPLC